MAAPMRSNSQEAGHRARVADPRTTAKPDTQASNFEYDDNEWDIGIGNLIIDLDADIEKTNEGVGVGGAMATNATPASSGKGGATKMAIEHSATVDKGLKMKIKRTKPGTKTSEAKHEIVKSNEQNGNADMNELKGGVGSVKQQQQHPLASSGASNGANNSVSGSGGGTTSGGSVANIGSGSSSKRGSSSHRRDKTRDKHTLDKPISKAVPPATSVTVSEVNGVVRVSVSQPGPQRPLFPSGTCPGPPTTTSTTSQPVSVSSPAAVVVTNTSIKIEPPKSVTPVLPQISVMEDSCASPPPAKKLKTDSKDVTDVCIGTSVGTITEPDCLGPCEPGTSVTLEGIVWHETEGGVLVVNVTWRGKTYVGTLLDCTRHDWAPPRFCDSPTSDLDSRTPKGRGKRGRAAAGSSPSTDLSNFTETRSSVHSKLRNGNIKGRRGGGNGSGSSTAPSSPTPFVPPPRLEPNNKRKNRTAEEEATVTATTTSTATTTTSITNSNTTSSTTSTTATTTSVQKRAKITITPSQTNLNLFSGSPPPSPILLECPEPNCSKKYKHINGLKYHQSHAHGSVDDDDTKDVTSMSENDESNIEAPSPVTPVKSPDKSQDSPLTPQKKDIELPLGLRSTSSSDLLEVPSQPPTPHSPPPSPDLAPCLQELNVSVGSPTVPMIEVKSSVVKPGVLLYNTPDEFPLGVFSSNKNHNITGTPLTNSGVRAVTVSIPPEQPSLMQIEQPVSLQSFVNQLPPTIQTQAFEQPPTLLIPAPNLVQNPSQLSPSGPESPSSKIAQFKVKPASALMPDDKKDRNKLPSFKKKSRKSPVGSPHPPLHEQLIFGMEVQNRDEVQSPAYSDISDDGTPIEPELVDKNKVSDKKTESGQAMSHMPQYGMYPFYGQTSYMMPSVQQPTPEANKPKEPEKVVVVEKAPDKEVKKEAPEYPQKVIQQQHYYNPYGYMPNYSYNMETNFSSMPIVTDDKIKEERLKESPSPAENNSTKPTGPIPNPIQVPTPGKLKPDLSHKEKQQNENHQILKESIEIKSQMSPYMYPRQPQQPLHNVTQREDDMRRFYVYPEQRRKEQMPDQNKNPPSKPPPPAPSLKPKEKIVEEKKEKEIKHEGVKPTMETQGPPPPPTSQYAYIHPSYMQSPHYGALPFDPNHPVYRGLMVPGPYSGNPYMHPQMPRYHAPEDLSRPPPPTKALDMLQHHAQYYSSHKIHELQERAIKSPTPKASIASSSPSSNNGPAPGQQQNQMPGCVTSQPSSVISAGGKQTPGDNKDSRSPPPQRHVHTHHHTHVGLGYPMYPAPYGAAVLASQQAAAVTVINPYPPK